MSKYDLPTLLALSQNAHIDLDKFSNQAVDNHLLRQHRLGTGILSERRAHRLRKASSFSHETENTSSLEPQLSYPYRSPQGSAHPTLTQTNSGFARFLKDHTSPKHQRVTAGGRIVPMEPQTLVPKMKLFSLPQKQAGYGDDQSITFSLGERESKPEGSHAQPVGINSIPSCAPPGILSGLARLSLMQGTIDQAHRLNMTPIIPTTAVNPGPFLQQPSSPFVGSPGAPVQHEQHPSSPFLPVPSNLSAYNLEPEALAYHPNPYSFLHSQNLYAAGPAPLLRQPATPVTPTLSTYESMSTKVVPASNDLSSGLDPQPYAVPQWHPYAGGQTQASIQPSIPQAPVKEVPYRTRLGEARKQHDNLSAQLSRIDRHMALHTWNIDPQSKQLLVEQRKSLVRELDAVRLYIEQLELLATFPNTCLPSYQNGVLHEASTPRDNVHGLGNLAGNHFVPASAVSNSVNIGQAQPPYSGSNPPARCFPASNPSNLKHLWQSTETSGFRGASGEENVSAGHHSLKWPRPEQPEVMNGTTERLAPGGTTAEEVNNDDRNWVTPIRSSRSDLRGLYHRISEATKQDDQNEMSQLLRELSIATSDLVQRKQKSVQSGSEETTPKIPQSRQAYHNQTASDHVMEHASSIKQARRPWVSEIGVGGHSNSQRNPMFEPERGNEDDISTSYVSTTDSWATTLPEGGRHMLDKGSVKSVNNTRPWPRHQMLSRIPLAPVGEQGLGSSAAAGSADKYEGIPNNHAPFAEPRGINRTTVANSAKHTCTLFIHHGLNRDHSPLSQKTVALTVSQNVNALAFLPPLDYPTLVYPIAR
ncbi:hypothetical protein FE257_011523 [Aspergillus nanangensis]|uniref:Uncharacterized protein n=1 Tax=Aspergillus nanangensis TaxID=2582783 RepID=A0AAD4GSG6_ASPNN|nr:hypothetical protein FE257_011523 [Aspergillus nanangensis]